MERFDVFESLIVISFLTFFALATGVVLVILVGLI